MKFVLGYRTELFMIFLVPIRVIRWYRFIRYSGTDSSAMMVPFHALRWYRLTDTIKDLFREYANYLIKNPDVRKYLEGLGGTASIEDKHKLYEELRKRK